MTYGNLLDLLPCPRCGSKTLVYFEGNKHLAEYVSCACGIDFLGSPEEWNTRQSCLSNFPKKGDE